MVKIEAERYLEYSYSFSMRHEIFRIGLAKITLRQGLMVN